MPMTATTPANAAPVASTPPAVPDEIGVIELARRFHDYYEEMASRFGYETRAETRTFDQYTPNGRLMIAVCRRLRASLDAPVASNTTAEPAPIQPAGVEVERDGWRLIKLATVAERSWSEDYAHENGHYFNTCCHCQRDFTGHKRRVVCKVCTAIDQALAAASQGDRGKT